MNSAIKHYRYLGYSYLLAVPIMVFNGYWMYLPWLFAGAILNPDFDILLDRMLHVVGHRNWFFHSLLFPLSLVPFLNWFGLNPYIVGLSFSYAVWVHLLLDLDGSLLHSKRRWILFNTLVYVGFEWYILVILWVGLTIS